MKYKGVTLFSAALILLGSVGTATSYIVDNPTNVSAADVDTSSISKLIDNLNSALSSTKIAKTESTSTEEDKSTTAKIKMYKATTDSSGKSVPSSGLSEANKYFSVDPTKDDANEYSTITKNSDGTYHIALRITIPAGLNKDAVTINEINGKDFDSTKVTESGDDANGYKMDFGFDVNSLDELKNPIPINMTMKIVIPPMPTINVTANAYLETDASDIAKAEDMFKESEPEPTPDPDTTAQDKIDSAKDDLSNLQNEKDNLDTKSDSLDEDIAKLKSDLADLKKDADSSAAAQKVISDITSKLSALQSKKDTIDDLISKLKDKITAISSDLKDAVSASADKKIAAIEKVKSAIDTAETAKDAIETKAESLAKGIKALSTTIKQAIADANAKAPVEVDDETGTDDSSKINDEYQVPYVVNKTDTNTASASSQYFTKTAYVTPNDDGTFSVEIQMEYPKSYGQDAVKIDSVNGINIDQSAVTTTSDDDNYYKSFKFNVDDLSDLNKTIPVTMDISIAGGIFSGTESADLVFDTTNLPITNPSNNTNKQVLDNGTGNNAATSGTTLGTTSGTLPQTDAKGLPTYIMYAGFLLLAVTLAGAGKVKLTGKK